MLVFELQLIANDQFSRFLAFLLIFGEFFTFFENLSGKALFLWFPIIHPCILRASTKIIDMPRWFLV